jgi:glycosyltransferase involved in cell wall biosynthesis
VNVGLRSFRWSDIIRRMNPRQKKRGPPDVEVQHDRDRRSLLFLTAIVGDTPSGGDYLIQTLAECMVSYQVEVTVVAAESSVRHLRSLFGGRLVTLSGNFTNCKGVSIAYLARSVWLIRNSHVGVLGEKPDILISGSIFLPDLVGALLCVKRASVWVLSWQLDVMPPSRRYFQNHSVAMRLKFLQSVRSSLSFATQEISLAAAKRHHALLVVPSRELKDRAVARGFPGTHVIVCGAVLDRSESRKKLNFTDRTTDFLFLGRFHAQKGLSDLLMAWDQIHVVLPHARLRVAGGGEGGVAEWFAQEKGKRADSVEYLGVVNGSAKWDLLDDTKVFLFPSTYESLGIVALEAISAGAVVVGYDIPSTTEAFSDGVIQVPVAKPEKLAIAALNIYQDRDAWDRQQQNGFRTLKRYLSLDSPESAAEKILAHTKEPPP